MPSEHYVADERIEGGAWVEGGSRTRGKDVERQCVRGGLTARLEGANAVAPGGAARLSSGPNFRG